MFRQQEICIKRKLCKQLIINDLKLPVFDRLFIFAPSAPQANSLRFKTLRSQAEARDTRLSPSVPQAINLRFKTLRSQAEARDTAVAWLHFLYKNDFLNTSKIQR